MWSSRRKASVLGGQCSWSPPPSGRVPKSRQECHFGIWTTGYSNTSGTSHFQKSPGVHKFLSAKFGFPPPPPKRARNEENCTNLYKILKIYTFSGEGGRGGGGNAILWTKRFYGHLGVTSHFPGKRHQIAMRKAHRNHSPHQRPPIRTCQRTIDLN